MAAYASLTPWHPFSFTPPKHWTRISGGAEQARKPKRHSNCNFYICNKQQKYEQWISKDPAEQAVYRNTLTSQKTLSSSWKIKRLQFNNTTKWPTFIDAKDLPRKQKQSQSQLEINIIQTRQRKFVWNENIDMDHIAKTQKLREYSELWQLLQFYHLSNHLSSKCDNSRPLSKKSAGPTGFSFQSNPLINRLNVFSSEKPFSKQVFRKDPILVSSFLILSI